MPGFHYLLTILLLAISCTGFVGCKSAKIDQRQAHPENNKTINTAAPQLMIALERYIDCLNNRDVDCLLKLYAEDYKSYSPVLTPADLPSFVRETVDNLRKNDFEVAIRIKDIDQTAELAYVIMDWQLKTSGTAEDSPFANVQRIDLWKLDMQNNWRIFRTVIYSEKAFR